MLQLAETREGGRRQVEGEAEQSNEHNGRRGWPSSVKNRRVIITKEKGCKENSPELPNAITEEGNYANLWFVIYYI